MVNLFQSRDLIRGILLSVVVLYGAKAEAQDVLAHRSQLTYLSAGFGPDVIHQNSWMGNFGLTTICPNGWGASVQMRMGNFTAEKLPVDYSGGFSFFESVDPVDAYEAYSIHAVREFFMPLQRFRFGLEAGPSQIVYKQEIFTPYSPAPSGGGGMGFNLGFGSSKNYTHERKERRGYGISLKAKAEFPFARTTGFEFCSFANINTRASLFGFELSWNIGKMRDAPGNSERTPTAEF